MVSFKSDPLPSLSPGQLRIGTREKHVSITHSKAGLDVAIDNQSDLITIPRTNDSKWNVVKSAEFSLKVNNGYTFEGTGKTPLRLSLKACIGDEIKRLDQSSEWEILQSENQQIEVVLKLH